MHTLIDAEAISIGRLVRVRKQLVQALHPSVASDISNLRTKKMKFGFHRFDPISRDLLIPVTIIQPDSYDP